MHYSDPIYRGSGFPRDELIIDLVLTSESISPVKSLPQKWMSPASSVPDIARFLTIIDRDLIPGLRRHTGCELTLDNAGNRLTLTKATRQPRLEDPGRLRRKLRPN